MLFLNFQPNLSELEYDIYKYISLNIEKVCYMRIRELASATHTSTSTILRFCKKFSCDGFSDFKFRLKLYFKKMKSFNPTKNDDSILLNFFYLVSNGMIEPQIKRAAELLKDKSLILFLGVGSSNIIAEYGVLYFSSIHKMAFRIEDPLNHPISYFPKKLSEKIGIIVLSVSGETREIIEYLTHINLSNSVIVSVTNSNNSTVAKISDVNISYYIETEYMHNADITSQVPALYIVEKIAHSLNNL